MELHDQLTTELAEGRRVIIAADTFADARRLFQDFVDQLPEDSDLVIRRTNGEEQVRHPNGGRVWFGSARSGRWRGLTADTLVITPMATDHQLQEIAPCIASAADRHLFRLIERGQDVRLETIQ